MRQRWFSVALAVWAVLVPVFSVTLGPAPLLAAGAATSTTTANGSAKVDCDAGSGGFTWFLCGMIPHALSLIDWIRDKVILPFLKTDAITNEPGGQYEAVYKFWTVMRNIASVCFILIFLLVIFGTAVGFDNYTIKKVLPHLVAGAILMPLSWYICTALVDVGNVLGDGVITLANGIITEPPTIDFTTPMSYYIYGTGGALIGITGLTALTQLTAAVLVTVALAFLVIFFTLVWRQVVIIFLIVLSPLAFLAFVLPNTQKYYSMWWTNLGKMILVFPLYVAVIEAARLFAAIVGTIEAYKDFVPLIQLTLLGVIPAVGLNWALNSGGGKAMAMGKSAFKRASGEIDKRWGKDSDRGKAQAQNRRNKYSLKADSLKTWGAKKNDDSKKVQGGVLKRMSARAAGRAAKTLGSATGTVVGVRAGSQSGLGFGKAGKLNKIKDLDTAIETEAKILGNQEIRASQPGLTTKTKVAQKIESMTQDAAKRQGEADAQSEAIASAGGIRQAAATTREGTFAEARLRANKQMGQLQGAAGATGRPNAKTIQEGSRLDRETELHEEYGGLTNKPGIYEDAEAEIGTRNTTGLSNRDLRLAQARGLGVSAARSKIVDAAAKGEAKFRTNFPTFTEGYTNALNKAAFETAKGDGEVIGNVEAMEKEIDKVMTEARASGRPLSREGARARVLTTANEASKRLANTSFRGARGAEEGVLTGHEKAIDEYMDSEAREGRPITGPNAREEAERRVMNSVSRSSSIDSSKKQATALSSAVATTTGFQKAAVEAAADTLMENAKATGVALSRDDALAQARLNPALAVGAGANQNVLTSAAGQRVLTEIAQNARQSTERNTLAGIQGERKAAQGDDEFIGTQTRNAIEADVLAAQERAGATWTPAMEAAERAAAQTRHTAPAGRQAIRNTIDSGIAQKAGTEASEKLQTELGNAVAYETGREQGRRVAEEDQINKVTEDLLARNSSMNPIAAKDQATREVRSAAGQARLTEILTDTRTNTAMQETAKQAAAAVVQPLGQQESQQAAIDQAGEEDQLQREMDRLAQVALRGGRNPNAKMLRTMAERNIKNKTALAAPASSPAQAAAAAIRVTARAKQEQSKRNQTGQEAGDIALDIASRSSSNASATDLLKVQQRAAEAAQARQEGEILGRKDEQRISYEQRVTDQAEATVDKIYEEGISADLKRAIRVPVDHNDPSKGMMDVRLESAELGPNVAFMEREAERAFDNGEDTRVSAIMQKLGQSSSGREAIRRLAAKKFGRDNSRTVDPSDPRLVKMYNAGISKISSDSAPDLRLAPDVSFDELKPNDWQKLDKRTMGHYLQWVSSKAANIGGPDPKASADAIKSYSEMVANFNGAFGPKAKSGALSGFEPNHYEAMRNFLYETGTFPDPADPTKTITRPINAAGAPAASAADMVRKPMDPTLPTIDPAAYTFLESTYIP